MASLLEQELRAGLPRRGSILTALQQSLANEDYISGDELDAGTTINTSSLQAALLNQDKGYNYGMLLPLKTRTGMDVDQLSTDYMEGDISLAVPGIAADAYNAVVEGSQMIRGRRPLDEAGITKQAIDILPMSGFGATMIPKAGGQVLGMNVFQGGPHKYGPEGAAESLQHIGKGEGATAYGYGRYDAGAEDVAKDYQKQLAKKARLESGGREVDTSWSGDRSPEALFASEVAATGDITAAVASLKSDLAEMEAGNSMFNKMVDTGAITDRRLGEMIVEKKKALNWYEKQAGDVSYTPEESHLYKHDLPDEDIARYLDWDETLSKQPESVRAALEQFGHKADPEGLRSYDTALLDALYKDTNTALPKLPADPAGEKMYWKLVDQFDTGDREAAKQAASEALARAGIPGLKYYDQMSRLSDGGADAKGTATRIFDAAGGNYDKAIEIAKGRQARNNKGPVDPTSNLSKAIKLLENKFDTRTRNYVTWDQEVLNRMKLLERNGEKFASDTGAVGMISRASEAMQGESDPSAEISARLGGPERWRRAAAYAEEQRRRDAERKRIEAALSQNQFIQYQGGVL